MCQHVKNATGVSSRWNEVFLIKFIIKGRLRFMNMSENRKLDEFILDYYEQEDRHSPTSATANGLHQYDSELEDYSQAGIEAALKRLDSYDKAFADINYSELDDDGKIKYHLMNENLKSFHLAYEKMKRWEKDPAFYSDIAIHSVFILLLRNFAPLEQRMKSAMERMKKIPRFLTAAKENLTNPAAIHTEIALESLQGGIAFFNNLVPQLADEVPDMKDEVLKARDIAVDAFEDYAEFLRTEIKPRSNGDFAIGKELLDIILTETEFLDYNSDDLWEIGQEELEKCEKELMEFVKREYRTDKPWREVFREMKKNHPSREKVLDAYREAMERTINFVRENNIVDIPENQQLVIMETPEFNRMMTPLAALMPAATFDEDKTGFMWITPVNPNQPPEAQEKQLMESCYGKIQYLALHEGYPGHHLQMVYASRVDDYLYKRTRSGIFIEGWAFYCEQMMKELSYFNRDGELAQLEAAYWRALRILLDIGLHTRRFTIDSALEFMQSKVDWAPFIAKGELKRYSRMPTQALSYYTGKLEIFRIRENYRKAKGDFSSLKQFHHELLKYGSLPPKVIEWKMGIREIEKPKGVPQNV
jgi:uncharacterized protein (DUF885 family)